MSTENSQPTLPQPHLVNSILGWFKAAVPSPTSKNVAVQIGCHYEEVAEMAEALGDVEAIPFLTEAAEEFKFGGTLEDIFGEDYYPDHVSLLDSLCDQIVTAIGVAHMFGMDIEGALAEVNRSNWSKFVDGNPVFDVNGKIAKPSSYSKPVLDKFVNPAHWTSSDNK